MKSSDEAHSVCKKDSFDGSLMHTVHTLYFLVQKRLQEKLSSSPISFSQFLVFAGFSCYGDTPVKQVSLAESLLLTEATLSRHIKVLSEKGLLIKRKDEDNKKLSMLKLSEKGKRIFEKTLSIVNKELEHYFSPLSQEEKEKVILLFSTTIIFLHKKE